MMPFFIHWTLRTLDEIENVQFDRMNPVFEVRRSPRLCKFCTKIQYAGMILMIVTV